MKKTLRRMHLCVHPLVWLDIPPGDGRRGTPLYEQWPGQADAAYRRETLLKPQYEQAIREIADDEGFFMLPLPAIYTYCDALSRFAQQHLGDRAVICDFGTDLSHERTMLKIREALGESFFAGVDEDAAQAAANRGFRSAADLDPEEVMSWLESKAFALNLSAQLTERGYTYDAATVEFEAFGQDWSYCCATFPILMAAVFGLSRRLKRRLDLINASCTPILLEATPIAQNLPLPENVSAFIARTTQDRLVAQCFYARHSITDPFHAVVVDFPADSVRVVNLWGVGVERSLGARDVRHGCVQMHVGTGGHTSHWPTTVMAEAGVSLDEFRGALMRGRVVPIEGQWLPA